MTRIEKYYDLLSNMGVKYVFFKIWFVFKKKTRLLSVQFPSKISEIPCQDFHEWCNGANKFFFTDKSLINTPAGLDHEKLKLDAHKIINGKLTFFSSIEFDLGSSYDWVTNPDTGFKYNTKQHWSLIESYDKKKGDIKYVWEKSRFSYFYTLIRDDHHNKNDHASIIKKDILDWINKNPLNCGPNYVCSQEISLRLLNWIFAFHYFKDRLSFNRSEWSLICSSIYWQLHHVRANINFSLITVRNNHALTETLALFLIPIFFPWFPNAQKWKKKGKQLLESELHYQIYEDGTFLQHSMNYHRVVIQLLTWLIGIAEANNETLDDGVYERAYKSLTFLYQCQIDENGYLPNYGSNDGALFFPLNSCDFRDYRPQLNALHQLLTGQSLYAQSGVYDEDFLWLSNNKKQGQRFLPLKKSFGISAFKNGGYFLFRDESSLTFIRCCSFHDRPAQADNLHIDIWVNGNNYLVDPGTYKYNAEKEVLNHFVSSSSHNTATIDGLDQMIKGDRFIWYKWVTRSKAYVEENENRYKFFGHIKTYRYLSNNCEHYREVIKIKNKNEWIITDTFSIKKNGSKVFQHWNINPLFMDSIQLIPLDYNCELQMEDSYISNYYGSRVSGKRISYVTKNKTQTTKILINKK